MNSLQIGLIAIGALVVAVLFLWHWWQGRPARDTTRSSAAARPADVWEDEIDPRDTRYEALDDDEVRVRNDTLDDEPHSAPVAAPAAAARGRQEPTWTDDGDDGVIGEPVVRGAAAPEVDDAAWVRQDEAADEPPILLEEEIDEGPPPMVASVADPAAAAPVAPAAQAVPAAAPIPVPDVLAAGLALPFDERLHVHALLVGEEGQTFDAAPLVEVGGRALAWVRLFRHSAWEPFDPTHVGSVQQLVLALPLASRGGAVAPQDLVAWRELVKQQATAQDCAVEFHGLHDAAERAEQLDAFLVAVDVIPVVYLVKRDGGQWPGTRLRGTLEANGFRLQSDGRFAYHEVESDSVIFHIKDGYETPFTPDRLRSDQFYALCCALEPARLERPMVRFDAFRQTLRALAKLLDGELKNSEGETIDDTAFAALREEVKAAMNALTDAGIEPGSDTAQSLFS